MAIVPAEENQSRSVARLAGKVSGVIATLCEASIRCAILLRRPTISRPGRIHILIPATAGSLGDEAVLSGIGELIQGLGLEVPVQMTLRDWKPHRCENAQESVCLTYDDRRIRAYFAVARALRGCSHLIILGTDIIEGNYSRSHVRNLVSIANAAIGLRIPVSIAAFSFSSTPDLEAVRQLKRLHHRVRCTARDPISASCFAEYVGRHADVVTDPAFAMRAHIEANTAVAAVEWIQRRRSAGDAVLGVNANAIAHQRAPGRTVEAYVAAMSRVMDARATSVLLLPHDLRDDQSDLSPLTEIQIRLSAIYPGRVHLLRGPVSGSDVKGLVIGCDLIVTGRLHLAIASLSQGRPAIGIEYHDKFRGIFRSIGVESLLLTQDELHAQERFSSIVIAALDQHSHFSDALARSRPMVEEGLRRLALSLTPTARGRQLGASESTPRSCR